jgi:hypothetical protein
LEIAMPTIDAVHNVKRAGEFGEALRQLNLLRGLDRQRPSARAQSASIIASRAQDAVKLRDSEQLSKTTRHVDQPERRASLDRRHMGLNELAQQEAVHVRHLAHVEQNRRLAAFNRRDEPIAKPAGRVALTSHVALPVDDDNVLRRRIR